MYVKNPLFTITRRLEERGNGRLVNFPLRIKSRDHWRKAGFRSIVHHAGYIHNSRDVRYVSIQWIHLCLWRAGQVRFSLRTSSNSVRKISILLRILSTLWIMYFRLIIFQLLLFFYLNFFCIIYAHIYQILQKIFLNYNRL